jgi:long-chain acyl-CoA synthetase
MQTIPAQLLANGSTFSDQPAYSTRVDGKWVAVTWAEYAEEIRTAARALISLGVAPGDRVAILGWNRPAWAIVDAAAMAIGAVPAGIYPTSSPEECEYVLNHSGAAVLLVQDEEQWGKIDRIRSIVPALRTVVTMPESSAIDDDLVMGWDAFLERADGSSADAVDARLAELGPDDMATLIYTSGTTGPPKAVMLSHENLSWTARTAVTELAVGPNSSTLSYLPLSHIAEQLFTIHGAASTGYQVFYAEDIAELATYLKEVRPTIFFAVPRVWEKFHAGISEELGKATGVKASLAARAMQVARDVHAARNRGEEPGFATKLQYSLFAGLVYSKVKEAIGLDRTQLAISGAAPITPELLEFFAGIDLPVLEEYGQSENTGVATINQPGHIRYGTVGQALTGIDVRIAEDDEILIRGKNVFLGYYKDEEATRAELRDGWLHSGDLGEIDADGYLSITGRKKDIIITAAGKNVAPAMIEGRFKAVPLISEAVVIGDRQRYLTALFVLDPDVAARHTDDEAIRAELDDYVAEINETLARVEQIKKYTVLDHEFTVDSGELTPTLKVKRNVVSDHYAAEITAMYAD